MDNLGETIRKLRQEKELPLRTVAAYLDVDQAILSKIERGQRNANREQVVKLATYFNVKEDDLLVQWLSDKLVYEVEDEDVALKALHVAEEKIEYKAFLKTDRKDILLNLKKVLKQFNEIEKAWMYGSFSRQEEGPKSDIDIAVQTKNSFSYFDLAEVQFRAEKLVNRKVDIGFIDSFKPYILEHVKPDLKLIMRNNHEESEKRLQHVLNAINAIEKHAKDENGQSFCENELLNNAVLFQFTVIGEALAHVEDEKLDKYDYPWFKVKAFRNMIAHEYFNIKLIAVWKIIEQDMPELKLVVEEMVKKEF